MLFTSEKTFNRPFPSSLVPLFENVSKCETFHMKTSSTCSFILMQINVICIRMVSHLDSHKGTRKWPIKSGSQNGGVSGALEPRNFCCGARSPIILLTGALILFLAGEPGAQHFQLRVPRLH